MSEVAANPAMSNVRNRGARVVSLHDAVKECVPDGDTVAMEGFIHLMS